MCVCVHTYVCHSSMSHLSSPRLDCDKIQILKVLQCLMVYCSFQMVQMLLWLFLLVILYCMSDWRHMAWGALFLCLFDTACSVCIFADFLSL